MAFGATLVTKLNRLRAAEVDEFYRRAASVHPNLSDRNFLFAYGGVCLVIFGCYVFMVPDWPLLGLLTGSSSTAEVNAARRDVLGPTMGTPLWYVFGVTRATLIPILAGLVVAMYPHLRTQRDRIYLVVLGVAALAYNSWSGAKTPVSVLFVMALLVMLLTYGVDSFWGRTRTMTARFRSLKQTGSPPRLSSRGTPRKIMALTAIIVVAYPVAIFSQKSFGQDRPLTDIIATGVVDRIMRTPAFLSYYQFEIFPEERPHTEFRDVRMLTIVTGQEYVDLSRVTGMMARGTAKTNAPPAMLGNFYAQGGIGGMVTGSLLVGAILVFLQGWVVRRIPPNPVSVAVCGFLSWAAFRLSMTAAHSVLMSEGIVVALLVLLAWRRSRSRYAIPVEVR